MFIFLMTNVTSYPSLLLFQWMNRQETNLNYCLTDFFFFLELQLKAFHFSAVFGHIWHLSITVLSLKLQYFFLLEFIESWFIHYSLLLHFKVLLATMISWHAGLKYSNQSDTCIMQLSWVTLKLVFSLQMGRLNRCYMNKRKCW